MNIDLIDVDGHNWPNLALMKLSAYDPYVMIYDKPNASNEIRQLQRWCNNRIIFKSCKRFEDYRM